MKRRLLALLLSLSMLVSMLVLPASAENPDITDSGTCGDNLTWVLTDDGTLTISGTGDMTDWDYNLDTPWNAARDTITAIVLKDGITSIGDYAFAFCTSLTSVTIPDSVTTIGSAAFQGCDSLITITIPDSVTSIGSAAFFSCDSLTEINIPDSVTYIGDELFGFCFSLTEINIPDGVTSIGDYAFYECTSLTEVSIPDSVASIGVYAFSGCTSLIEINIPEGVTSIEFQAFCNCSSLTEIIIPDSVTYIGEESFHSCASLTEITIPDSVTSIDNHAFAYCTSLTDITFEGNAPEISRYSFYNVTATAYYPSGDDTWTEDVMQNYGGTITWVAYTVEDSGDGDTENNDTTGESNTSDAETETASGIEAAQSEDGEEFVLTGLESYAGTTVSVTLRYAGSDGETVTLTIEAEVSEDGTITIDETLLPAEILAGTEYTITVETIPDDSAEEAVTIAEVTVTTDFVFTDDDGTGNWSWASTYIYACYSEGIITGYADGDGYSFILDDDLTRAEAATIIARAYDLELDESIAYTTFTDDNGTGNWSWAGEYIYACVQAGIINGYTDGTYLLDQTVTRVELAKMIAAAEGLVDDDTETPATSSFTDVPTSHWGLVYIEACVDAGIINGYAQDDGTYTFQASNNVTRAEAATMIARALGLAE